MILDGSKLVPKEQPHIEEEPQKIRILVGLVPNRQAILNSFHFLNGVDSNGK